jgi:uncharacterized membrane protein
MESYLLDWANLLLRWLHVIVAIAWIGASFYFVWADNHLLKPESPELKAKGVDGELWAVHGGGFYNPQKYLVAPRDLPKHLHWFYWESYWTWISGMALFTVLYLFNADSFLIDGRVLNWSVAAAVSASLGFMVAGWLVYDQICRRFGHIKVPQGRRDAASVPQGEQGNLGRPGVSLTEGSIGNDGLVLGLIAVFIAMATWAATQLFAGRAAFLIIGAMMATMMSANVFFWIIPGQRQVLEDMRAGRAPNPIYGQRGKQRSVHNTYFTLPVLVAMLSNHYGMLYSHAQNWLVLIVLMLAGALVRTYFVKRHKGVNAWGLVVAVLVMLAGLIAWMAPAKSVTSIASVPPSLAQVQVLVGQRCVMCHNAQLAQKGVRLDTAELIEQNAPALYQQAVVQKTMPLNNATQISDAERALLGRWFETRAAGRH